MTDIFLAYASEDRERVETLAEALAGAGWSVFWDRTIPTGLNWHSFVGKALSEARCVVVAWSKHSIRSDWVLEEAGDARKRDVLIPVLLDSVDPPLGFGSLQALDLTDWSGESDSSAVRQLVTDMERLLGPAPALEPLSAEETKRTPAKGAEEVERPGTGKQAGVESPEDPRGETGGRRKDTPAFVEDVESASKGTQPRPRTAQQPVDAAKTKHQPLAARGPLVYGLGLGAAYGLASVLVAYEGRDWVAALVLGGVVGTLSGAITGHDNRRANLAIVGVLIGAVIWWFSQDPASNRLVTSLLAGGGIGAILGAVAGRWIVYKDGQA